MHTRIFILVLTICLMALPLGGCKDKEESSADIVKTDAEYKAEAAGEITKDNMLDELDKLEKMVEQDSMTE